MADVAIVTLSQFIEINPVGDVAVTDVKHDDEAGNYYRDIVFFGEVPEQATATVDQSTIPTILKIRIRSATVEQLHISVPGSEF